MGELRFARPNGFAYGDRLEQRVREHVDPDTVVYVAGEELVITGPTITNQDRDVLRELVITHDSAPTEPERREHAVRAKLIDAVAVLEDGASSPSSWSSLTAAQRQEAARRTTLAVCKLVRLVLGRLDVPES